MIFLGRPVVLSASLEPVGLQRLDDMFGVSSTSNCSGAVDMKDVRDLSLSLSGRAQLSTHLSYNHAHSDPTRYVNIGSGTTGTKSIFHILCTSFNMSGLHWGMHCSNGNMREHRSPLMTWVLDLTRCVSKFKKEHCNRKSFVRRYRDGMSIALAAGGSFWADTPVSNSFVDIISIHPDLSIISTYRNPIAWVRRRKANHDDDLICNPVLWNHPGLVHPFDLYGCLRIRSDEVVSGDFKFIRDLTDDQLRAAYVRMNNVNTHLAVKSGRPFLPVCLWDQVFDSPVDSIAAAFPELQSSFTSSHKI